MTQNELMQLESIRHALALQGYSNYAVSQIIRVLNRTDERLAAELALALGRLDPDSFTVQRLEAMLSSVRQLNREAYSAVQVDLVAELQALTVYESSYQTMMLTTMNPFVSIAAINAEQVYAAAVARPFQGALLRDFLTHQEESRMRRVQQAIAQGFVEGKTNDQIIREIVGTRSNRYADGLLEISRRDAEAVVRTAVGHLSGFVQDRAVEANADLIKAVKWSATLDTRTSPICRPRDGKLYEPVSHKPIGHSLPWLGGAGRAHWRCRSSQAYVMKSNKELGIDLPDITVNGTRASMDGQVPADVDFGKWLASQSAERQDAVLGKTRGKLLREGKIKMDQIYDSKGRMLTLDQLRAQDAKFLNRE